MTQLAISIRQRFDRYGILLAGMCAVHCFAALLIVSLTGAGSHFLLAPEIHEVGLAFAFVIATFAIGWGLVIHRNLAPFALAAIGLALMGAALVVGHGVEEVILTVAGVALVAVGHVMNLRARPPARPPEHRA